MIDFWDCMAVRCPGPAGFQRSASDLWIVDKGQIMSNTLWRKILDTRDPIRLARMVNKIEW